MATTGIRSNSCVKTGLSKLKRPHAPLSPLALAQGVRVVCALAALYLLAGPVQQAMAQPRETMIWLLRDLPPLMIFEGPKKSQGVIDQLLPLLADGMPQYRHILLRVNRARALQMLHEPSLTCDAALNWSRERERWIAFSIPVFRAMSNGLAVRRVDHEIIAPYVQDGEVDLAALLNNGHEQLGVIGERNYGEYLDGVLRQAPAQALTAHYGNDALGSLLQMQRRGRLRFLLGYRPEIRYQAQQQGIAEDELQFYPIRGAEKYLSGYIGCNDTPQGRQAIGEINQLLRKLPQQRLSEAYAAWLDPESRSTYLEESRRYFEEQGRP